MVNNTINGQPITRTEEQIQSNLTGPKRVYGSDEANQTTDDEASCTACRNICRVVPEVKPEAPTVKPTLTSLDLAWPGWQKALDRAGSWFKGVMGL